MRKKKEVIELNINELPEMLKAIRESKGLTMQKFADMSGLKSRQEVYHIETRRTPLGLNRFCDICTSLQIAQPTIKIIL